jgi:hypothetical protein
MASKHRLKGRGNGEKEGATIVEQLTIAIHDLFFSFYMTDHASHKWRSVGVPF